MSYILNMYSYLRFHVNVLATTGVIYILTVILTYMAIDSHASGHVTHFIQNPSFDDTYVTNDELAYFEANSELMCSMSCFYNDQCKSFSYNTLCSVCQHFRVALRTNSATGTNQSGWLQYNRQQDCEVLLNAHYGSGIYAIYPIGTVGFRVSCNMRLDGGGWTVIQQRYDGTVDFQRSWDEYKQGFGNLDGEFWIGNDKIHALTTSAKYELRVDIKDWENNHWYAVYKTFTVEDENSKYKLTIGDYSGTAGDSMALHNGMFFSTMDADNDISSMHCSVAWGGSGGWWYYDCDEASLNGLHKEGSGSHGINWLHAKNSYYSMQQARMAIRRL